MISICSRRGSAVLLAAASAALLVVIVRAAWLCDDAYITIRTVDNFVHGLGLRWNVDERVQTYTHPLWMWALVPGYAITGSARLTLLGTSIAASIAAVAMLARIGRARAGATLAVLIALAGSKSFVEYSTSGLEESLLFVLLAAAMALAMREESRPAATAGWFAGLVLVTRLDAGLLALPLLARSLAKGGRAARRTLTAAALPAALWAAFSVVYYGVPFPNTAYAKLGHGVPRAELIQQGGRYLADFAFMDPVGAAFVLGAIAWGIVRRRWEVVAAIGLWTSYVVWVGGDFMSGRLLAPAVWLSAVFLARTGPGISLKAGGVAGLATLSLLFAAPAPAIWGPPGRGGDGRTSWRVTDERQFYYPTTGLLLHGLREEADRHPWPRRVLDARERGENVQVFKWVGFAGYFAGPRVHLIDPYGLTDPLLARLPADSDWAPGHFLRQVPSGYPESVSSGTNHIQDGLVGRYYERLGRVTREPLLAPGRLRAILWLNFQQPRVPSAP
ncbi:MAG: hypothetical protein IT184_07990 [Acidobacteria bacterium]|nr:hypothetical protein [Acidobacteriota bacterium]